MPSTLRSHNEGLGVLFGKHLGKGGSETNPWRSYSWQWVSWKQRWQSSIIWLRSWRKIDDFRQKPQSMRRSPNWRKLTRDLVEPSIPHGFAFAELLSCSCMPASLCLETGCCRAKNASNVLMKNLVNVCGGTMGWWIFGWAFAYGEQHGNGFIGTDGFFGTGFYTRDASTGVITPVECNSDGCQSTMLSWFFQCLTWSLSSSLVTLREETSWRVRAKHTTYLFHRIISLFHNRSQWEIGGFRQVFCYPYQGSMNSPSSRDVHLKNQVTTQEFAGDHIRFTACQVGILHGWCYYCERSSCRACEEPHLCCLCFLHD